MDVDGVWEFAMSSPMGDRPGRLELATKRGALTGTWMVAAGSVAISEGRVDGDRVSWTIDSPNSPVGALRFTATVEGDRLVGEGRVGDRPAFQLDARRVSGPAPGRRSAVPSRSVAAAVVVAVVSIVVARRLSRGGRRRGRRGRP